MFTTSSDRTPVQRLLAGCLIVLQVLSPALYAGNTWAQAGAAAINPDRSVTGERPVVNVAANGVPIVQIAPPSAAGVSNNRFTDYNVGSKGAILNNSGANNQTQLGGWIAGNPMLGNGSARTILNQVTGVTPSSLNGFTEVAGNRANVIVANPNGITCDGCGFINAPRATITTGTPQLGADGGVLGFSVQQGRINIEGQGLAARNLDQVDLISRSLRVNAEVWANKLEVATGAARVDYNSGEVSAQTAPDAVPPVALDVSQFGGMYANSIRLIGTENGVGVNSAGAIEALTGTLEINQAGDVRITAGYVQAAGDLTMQSGQDISNAGAVDAQGKVAIEARGALRNSGMLTSAGDLQGKVGSLANSGSIAAGANAEGQVTAPHDLSIAASGDLQNDGRMLAGNNLTLSGDSITLNDGTVNAGNRLEIAAGAILENRKGKIFAKEIVLGATGELDNTDGIVESETGLAISAPRIDNTRGAFRQTAEAGTASGMPQGIVIDNGAGQAQEQGILINDQGSIASNTATAIAVRAISNLDGAIQAKAGLSVHGENGIDNTGGKLLTDDALSISTSGRFTNDGGEAAGGRTVSISSAGGLVNNGGSIEGDAIRFAAPSIDNTRGSVVQTGADDQSIRLSGDFNNAGGTFASNAENITLEAGGVANVQGEILHGGTGTLAAIAAGSLDNSQGIVSSMGRLVVSADSVLNTEGELSGAGNASVTANSVSNADGMLAAGGGLKVQASGALNNQGGLIRAEGELTLDAAALNNGSNAAGVTGQIAANGSDAMSVTVTGKVDNAGGYIGGKGDVSLSAGSLANANGTLFAAGELAANIGGDFDNAHGIFLTEGQLAAHIGGTLINRQGLVQGSGLDLRAGGIVNGTGNIQQVGGGAASIAVAGALDNADGRILGEGSGLSLAAGSIDNHAGTISHAGGGLLSVRSEGAIDNRAGEIAAAGTLSVAARELDNSGRGLIDGRSDSTLAVDGGLINHNGTIVSGGNLEVGAGSLDNGGNGLIQSASSTAIAAGGDIANGGGAIVAGGTLALNAGGDIGNARGTIEAGDALAIAAQNVDNARGRIVSLGDGDLSIDAADTLNNNRGYIGANGSAAIGADSFDNTKGEVVTTKDLAIVTDKFVNKDGVLDVGGALSLHMNDAFDNSGNTLSARGGLNIRAASIDNSADANGVAGRMTVTGAGALTLEAVGGIDNTGGYIGSNGNVGLIADSVGNAGGTVYARQAIAITTAKQVDNTQGTVQADAELTARIGGALGNRQGLIQADRMDLQAGSLSNAGGQLLQLGEGDNAVGVAGAFDNAEGILLSNGGNLAIAAGSLDNSEGIISHAGDGKLSIASDGAVNNNGGRILSDGEIALDAQSVTNITQNGQAGLIQSGKDTVITTAGDVGNAGGSVVSSAALSVLAQGNLDNSGGTLQAANTLALQGADIDNTSGYAVSLDDSGIAIHAVNALTNRLGFIGGSGSVELTASSVANSGGTLYARQAMAITTAAQVDNTQGTVQADAELTARIGGALGNRQGLIQAGVMDLQAGSLDNVTGRLLQLGASDNAVSVKDAFNNAEGTLSSNGGNLAIAAGSLDNSAGTISHAGEGKLDIASTGTVGNNGGKLLTAGEIAIDAQSVTNNVRNGQAGMIQSGKAASIMTAGDFGNAGGSVVAGGALRVQAQGNLDNSSGTLQAANALALQGANIDNTEGRVVSLDDSDVTVNAVDALTNDQGVIGGNGAVALNAGSIGNNAGKITGVTDIDMSAGAYTGNNGSVIAGGALTATIGGALNSVGGNIQAEQLSVTAGSLDNSTGTLQATGTGPFTIAVSGDAVNTAGFIGGNGNVILNADNVDNTAGTVYAAKALDLAATGQINNTQGTLQADAELSARAGGMLGNRQGVIQADELDLQAGSLDNHSGQLLQLGGDDTVVSVTGAFGNTEGALVSNGGNLAIAAGSLDNSEGSISHAGDGKLDIDSAGAINNNGGKILTAGEITIDAQSVISNAQNGQAGLIQSGKNAVITTTGDFGNAGGSVVSDAALSVQAQGNIDNSGGTLQAANALALQATNIDNTAGQAVSLDASGVTIGAVDALTNDQGTIGGNGSVALEAGAIGNNAGSITGVANIGVTAGTYTGNNGNLIAGDALNIQVSGALNSVGGNIQAEQLSVTAGSLDNSTGTLQATGTDPFTIAVSGDADNAGGFIGGNGDVILSASNVDNTAGTIYAAKALDLAATGQINNTQGTLQADAELSARAGGMLGNRQGVVQAGGLDLQAGSLDNHSGQLLQLGGGDTVVSVTGAFGNTEGALVSNGGNLAIAAGSLDNSEGSISHAGEGKLDIDSTGVVHNNGGKILTAGEITIDAQSVISNAQNGQASLIQSGKNAAITVGGNFGNAGGSVVSGAALSVQAQGNIDNNGGTLQVANALLLQGANIDNTAGQAVSLDASGVTVDAANALTNDQGAIGGNGAVALNAGSIGNNAGKISGVTDIDMSAGAYTGSNGSVIAGGALNIQIGGALNSAGGTLQAERMSVSAGSLDNSAGKLLATGADPFTLTVSGDAVNAAGFIGGNGNVILNADNVDNTGGTLFAKNDLALDARKLDNTGGTLQADAQLAVTVTEQLVNKQGVIQAERFVLQAPSLDNTAGKLLQLGSSDTRLVFDGAIDNTQGEIATNGGNLVIAAASLDNSEGSISHAGEGKLDIDSAGAVDNNGGKILTAGEITIDAQSVTSNAQNGQASLIQSGKNAVITSAGDFGNAGGSVISGAALSVRAQGNIDNNGGTLQAGNALLLQGTNIDNTSGRAVSLDDSGVTIDAANALTNDQGTIGGNGAVALNAGSIGNNAGKISGVTDIDMSAGAYTGNNGSVIAGGALNAQIGGALNSVDGTLQAERMSVSVGSLDNSAGKLLATGTDPFTLTVSGDAVNAAGFIGGNGNVILNADNVDNTSGTLFAKNDLVLGTGKLNNTGGTLQADAQLAVTATEQLVNKQGVIQAERFILQAPSLDNTAGKLLQLGTSDTRLVFDGAIDNTQGEIATNGGNLVIAAASLDNSEGSITHAGEGKLDIDSVGAVGNNGGKILTAGEIAIDAQSVINNAQNGQASLIQSGKNAAITVGGDFGNAGGSVVSGAALSVQAQGNIDNNGGALQAGNALLLQGANIDNTAGQAVSLDASGVTIDAANALTNDQGTIGGNGAIALNAIAIGNNAGSITAVADIDMSADTYIGANGSVIAGGALNAHISGALNSAGGTLQAEQLSVIAGSLDNSAGKLLATGADPFTITVSGDAVNAAGFIGGNGNVILNADNVDNTGGTLFAKNDLVLGTGKLNNTGGTLQADAQLAVTATEQLVNKQGVIQAERFILQAPSLDNTVGKLLQLGTSDTRLVFDGAIDNTQGEIATNGGNLVIAAASLDNSEGSISHAGEGKLDIDSAGAINNNGGKILTAGEIAIDAQNVTSNAQNGQASLIQSGKKAVITSAGDFGNAGGSVISGAALSVQAQGNIDNSDGTLQAANVLTLQGAHIDNTAGRAVSLDASGMTIDAAGPLTNDQGTIGGNGAVAISADSIGNTQGTVTGVNNVDLIADTIGNAGGEILSQKQLTIDTGASGVLSNTQQGLLQGERLKLIAPKLSNAGGSIIQTGAGNTHLQVDGTLDNSNGTIASNGNNLTLSAQAINNNGGLIKHGGTQTLTITPSGAIGNSGGTISSNGNAIISATTIANTQQGRIEAAGTLTVGAGVQLNNNGGVLQSDGALTVTTPDLRNAGGGVYSNGTLTLAVPGFDNTGGAISADRIALQPLTRVRNAGGSIIQSGSGNLNLSVSSDVDNAGGTIAANGNLTLGGSTINNQGGAVRAANNGSLSIHTGGALNNAGGTLAAGGALTAQAASLNNQSGDITSTQRIALSIGGAIDNRHGTIAAGGDTQVGAGSFNNRHGTLAAVSGTLTLNTASHLDNTGGRLESGRNLSLNLPGLTNDQGVIVGDNIQIDTQGHALANSGGKIAARGALTVDSGQLTNSGGLLQAAGALSIDTHGAALINTQSGSTGGIVGQGSVTIHSGSLDNRGGFIGGTGALAIDSTGQIDNSAGGQIIGNGNVDLTATGLNNAGGQVQGRGNVSVHLGGGALDNRGGLARASGTLIVNAGGIDNSNTQGTGQGLEGTDVTLTAAAIGNAGGAIHADNLLTLNGASLNNTQGTVSSAHTLVNNTASITNTGGTLIAAHKLVVKPAAIHGAGQYLSNGDLDFSYSGDYTNSSRLVASGNLNFHSGGTLVNSGQIGANHTLNLSAANLNNQASGQISAGATHITVSGTLNNNGVIDGAGTTRIVAGNLINTHQIYGGRIAIQSAGLANEPKAVIASRGDLDIGVGTLINRNDALILAARDMKIGRTLSGNSAGGAADAIYNQAATIEAHRHMAIATNFDVHNSNSHVSTSTQTLGSQHFTEYRPRGWTDNLAPGSFAFNGIDHGRLVLDSALYPIAAYGTMPYGAATVFNCEWEPCTTYSPTDPVWTLFGIPSPGPEPVYPKDFYGNGVCDAESYFSFACYEYQSALQQWKGRMDDGSRQLDQKIAAFNGNLRSRMVEDYYIVDFTRSTTQTTVHAGQPGQILAGGNISFTGSGTVTNDMSRIIAGGDIGIAAHLLNNIEHKQQKQDIDTGTEQFTEIVSSGWFGGHKRISHAAAPYTDKHTPVDLGSPDVFAYTKGGKPDLDGKPGALTVITVGQNATGAANANGSTGNLQSAGGSTGVGAVNAAGGNNANPGTGNVNGSTAAAVNGQSGASVTDATAAAAHGVGAGSAAAVTGAAPSGAIVSAAAEAAHAVTGSASTGVGSAPTSTIGNAGASVDHAVAGGASTGVSGNASTSTIGNAGAAAGHAVAGGASTGVTGSAPARSISSAGVAADHAVTGSAGTGVSGTASGSTIDNASGNIAGTVAGNASATAVDGAGALAANTIDHTESGSAPHTDGTAVAVAHADLAGPESAGVVHTAGLAPAGVAGIQGSGNGNIEIRSSVPDLRIPSNVLYQTRTEPGIGYLVETDPRFANYQTWLSSDFMLAQLNNDPATTLKRLGDGFYEQKLVIDQIMYATGQRYTGDYTSNEEQYQALMQAGVEFGKAYQLTIGVALSEEQMKQLTGDLVWLVQQDVTLADGSVQSVLVPQVYVRVREGDIKGDGTLIAAREVRLDLTGDLDNNALIASRGLLQADAQNIRNRDGGRLQGATVDLAARTDIDNLSGKIGGNTVSLDAGRDINIRTGTIDSAGLNTRRIGLAQIAGVSGNDIAISAGRDLTIAGARVDASGDALLSANRNLTIDAVQTSKARDIAVSGQVREQTVNNVGSGITAGGNLIAASGLTRDGDLTVRGSALNAGRDLTAAGTNVVVQSAVDTHDVDIFTKVKKGTDSTTLHQETAVGAALVAGENLTVVAKGSLGADGKALAGSGDLILKGAQISNGQGVITLAANNNVDILEQQLNQSKHTDHVGKNSGLLKKTSSVGMTDNRSQEAAGSAILGDRIAIKAGNDATIRGSSVVGTGDVSIYAKNDVKIVAAEQKSSGSNFAETKSSATGLGKFIGATVIATTGLVDVGAALMTSKAAKQNAEQTATQVVGSTISGNNVDIASGRDTQIQGSTVVADANIDINAARNLAIVSAQETQSEKAASSSKVSGFVGSFWQPAVGTVKQNQNGTSDSITQVGSQIVSLGTSGAGNVTLKAGEQYTQTASDVLATAGDVGIGGKNVLIGEAYDTSNAAQHSSYSKVAIGGSVSVPLLNAVQGLKGMADAARDTGDSRMQALAAINAGMNAKAAAESAQALAGGNLGGIKVSVSLGSTKSESSSTQTASTVVGSTVAAGGNVTIEASGAGKDSNLTAVATGIQAGNNVTLQADNQVNLLAAQSTLTEKSDNKSSGASIGIGFAFGGGQNGFTLELAANKARGNTDGSDVTNVNTHVQAGNTAAIQSGGDTTLKGAVVSGNSVTTDIGGNLHVESLQDSSKFDSKQSSAGVGISLCIPPFCYGASSVSGSVGKSKVNADYLSVVEQSGIKAGDGGFDVTVKGNTDLKGAVIASTQAAIDDNKNTLVTASLTQSELQNRDVFEAKGYSVSATVSGKLGDQSSETAQSRMNDKDKAAAAAPATPGASGGTGSAKGSQGSVTASGISGAAVTITDESKQKELTGQDAATTIAKAATGVTTDKDTAGALTKAWDGKKLQDQVNAQVVLTQAFSQTAPRMVADFAGSQAADLRKKGNEEEAKKWDEGGIYRVALHTATGALSGGASGAASAATIAAAAPLLDQLQAGVQEALVKNGMSAEAAKVLAQGLAQAAATGVGAVVGGTQGAATALTVDTNNRQLHPREIDLIQAKAKDFVERMKQAGVSITEEQAHKILAENAADQVDREDQRLLNNSDSFTNALAKQFLQQISRDETGGFVDSRGLQVKYFTTETVAGQKLTNDFYNSTLYSEAYNSKSYQDFAFTHLNKNLLGTNPTPDALRTYVEREKDEQKRALAAATLLVGGGATALAAKIAPRLVTAGAEFVKGCVASPVLCANQLGITAAEVATDGAVMGVATTAAVTAKVVDKGIDDAVRTVNAAVTEAKVAAGEARVINNFYRDGSELPQALSTSSGVPIQAAPEKTTTVLGSYASDMDNIINGQLGYPKTTDFGAKPGGFNVLNVPDNMYKAPDQFWNEVNRPFLDAAIQRGDEIYIATKPTQSVLVRDDGSLTGFGREMQYLAQHGYRYDVSTGKMVKR